MSTNLHKDLNDLQLHVPKGFSTAANSTKLTKDASGNLVWVADSSGTNTEVTITSDRGSGDRLSPDTIYIFSPPSGNNEHKFSTSLGSVGTSTITPKNSVGGSILTITKTGDLMESWTGKVYGSNNLSVEFQLLHVPWGDCQQGSTPLTYCVLGTTGQIILTGNNSPTCFDITSFSTCAPSPIKGDLIVLAVIPRNESNASFAMTQTIRLVKT